MNTDRFNIRNSIDVVLSEKGCSECSTMSDLFSEACDTCRVNMMVRHIKIECHAKWNRLMFFLLIRGEIMISKIYKYLSILLFLIVENVP